jgi:urea transport system substrate-binding protein
MASKRLDEDLEAARQAPRAENRCRIGALLLVFFWTLVGCDLPDEAREAIVGKANVEPIRVGILVSQTGTMAISETPIRHTLGLAIEEINASGGLLGRPLQAIVSDGRSRSDLFVKRTQELLDQDVEVIFGGWRSVDRKAILPVIEQAQSLLFYPLQYEGNECSRSVFYTGMTPNQQILPALDWFMSDAGGAKRRVFLVGSDYVFPRTANYVVRKYLEKQSMEVVGEVYVPFGHREFDEALTAIQEAQADLVLNTLNGDSNVSFYSQFHQRGITSNQTPILATSIGESELRSLPAESTRGHFAAWSFFQSLKTSKSLAFVENFQKEFGTDRVVNDPMEAAYVAIHLWKRAVEAAGSTDPEAIRKTLEKGISFEGPGGEVRIDPRNHHLYKTFRLGRIRDDQQFDIVYESPEPIRPEPYPAFAFPDWSCDWTREGHLKGRPVLIGP